MGVCPTLGHAMSAQADKQRLIQRWDALNGCSDDSRCVERVEKLVEFLGIGNDTPSRVNSDPPTPISLHHQLFHCPYRSQRAAGRADANARTSPGELPRTRATKGTLRPTSRRRDGSNRTTRENTGYTEKASQAASLRSPCIESDLYLRRSGCSGRNACLVLRSVVQRR